MGRPRPAHRVVRCMKIIEAILNLALKVTELLIRLSIQILGSVIQACINGIIVLVSSMWSTRKKPDRYQPNHRPNLKGRGAKQWQKPRS